MRAQAADKFDWIKLLDEKHKHFYYFNLVTKASNEILLLA